jgi:hypothetical protein
MLNDARELHVCARPGHFIINERWAVTRGRLVINHNCQDKALPGMAARPFQLPPGKRLPEP